MMCPIVVSKILHIYTNEISFSQLQECNAAQPCIALVISEAEYKKKIFACCCPELCEMVDTCLGNGDCSSELRLLVYCCNTVAVDTVPPLIVSCVLIAT